MGYEELAAHLLSNLLAAPYNLNQQQQAVTQQRGVLTTALGPEFADQIQQWLPNVPLAPDTSPVLGSQALGTGLHTAGQVVGNVGHVLQLALGNAPDAPRPPLDAFASAAKMKAQREGRASLADLVRAGAPENEVNGQRALLGLPPQSGPSLTTYMRTAAITAFREKHGRDPTAEELAPLVLAQAQQQTLGVASGRQDLTEGVRARGAAAAQRLLGGTAGGQDVNPDVMDPGLPDPTQPWGGGPPIPAPESEPAGPVASLPGGYQPTVLDQPMRDARTGQTWPKGTTVGVLDVGGGNIRLRYPNGTSVQLPATTLPSPAAAATEPAPAEGDSGTPAGMRAATLGEPVTVGGTVATGGGSSVEVKNPEAVGAVAQSQAFGSTLGQLQAKASMAQQEAAAAGLNKAQQQRAVQKVYATPTLSALQDVRAAVERIVTSKTGWEAAWEKFRIGVIDKNQLMGEVDPQVAQDIAVIETQMPYIAMIARASGGDSRIGENEMAFLQGGLSSLGIPRQAALARIDVMGHRLATGIGEEWPYWHTPGKAAAGVPAASPAPAGRATPEEIEAAKRRLGIE